MLLRHGLGDVCFGSKADMCGAIAMSAKSLKRTSSRRPLSTFQSFRQNHGLALPFFSECETWFRLGRAVLLTIKSQIDN
jgi:hypothetical protein